MRKTLGKVVLAVLLAGLLTGGLAIASAATKVRTVTTPRGTTVDVISVTGTVTEVSAPATTTTGTGFMGMFRHQQAGYAKIKDSTDGTVYTIELGREETASLTMKVGDTVTVEGTSTARNGVNELRVWTFTGADGKTVTLCNADGTPNIQTVSVAGTVIEVNLPAVAAGTTRPAQRVIPTIKVKQADNSVVTVVLGRDATTVTVKVGDSVKVEGFKTPMDANTIMATSFTGADGKTVTLEGRGFGGRGGYAEGSGRGGRGFHRDSGTIGSTFGAPLPSGT
jgi:uncharacterized membrane protein (UPF0127 family)